MNFILHTGTKIPALAFGTGTTYFRKNEAVTEGVINAYENGFRYIDTAIIYETEEAVGVAIQKLISEKGIKREDIFVATKVNADQYTFEKVSHNAN